MRSCTGVPLTLPSNSLTVINPFSEKVSVTVWVSERERVEMSQLPPAFDVSVRDNKNFDMPDHSIPKVRFFNFLFHRFLNENDRETIFNVFSLSLSFKDVLQWWFEMNTLISSDEHSYNTSLPHFFGQKFWKFERNFDFDDFTFFFRKFERTSWTSYNDVLEWYFGWKC